MQRRQGLHDMKGLLNVLLSPTLQASRHLHACTVSAPALTTPMPQSLTLHVAHVKRSCVV